MPRTAEIIAVGSELLTGGVTNTNARFLSELLTAAGVDVLYHTAVGDDENRLEAAVTAAARRAELLVFTGGLGPTYDDMTKTAVCAALDTPLVYHPEAEADIRRYFDTVFHREMPACNLQQAYLPAGCTVFRNPVGTAPGCAFTACGVTAVLLPGVPSECRYLAEHCLLPYLEQRHGQVIRAHDLRIFGLTEPQVQELLSDLLRQEADLTLSPFALPGEVSLHLSARADDEAACEARMAPVLAEVRRRLGGYLYGEDVSGLEEAVFRLCRDRHLTLSAAESCTGGLIAKRLTDVPGASQVFLGGVVSYTNGVKTMCWGYRPPCWNPAVPCPLPWPAPWPWASASSPARIWPCPSPGWPGRTATTGATRLAPCLSPCPHRRASLSGSWRWAATGRVSAPCPPTTPSTCCAAISPIK